MTAQRYIVMILFTCFVFLSFQSAVEANTLDTSGWLNVNKTAKVPNDKVWHIDFNTVVAESSITTESVFITNSSGKRLPTSVTLTNGGKTAVILPPHEGYHLGEAYTIYISDQITSPSGTPLKRGIIFNFTIEDVYSNPVDEEYNFNPGDSPVEEGIVTTSVLNIRNLPSMDGKVVGKLAIGTKVQIYDVEGHWALIKYNGKNAFVHKDFLKRYKIGGRLLEGRKIVIDAGHGDQDPGASANGLREKDVVLDVSLKVRDKLKLLGADVIMTRSNDQFVSLRDRVVFAKTNYADSFVSIHGNAATNKSAQGSEVFYDTSENDNGIESGKLAKEIQAQLVTMASMKDRGAKNYPFYVIKNNDIPSVLVELGFLTNNSDAEKMKNTDLFSDAVVKGILNYYQR